MNRRNGKRKWSTMRCVICTALSSFILVSCTREKKPDFLGSAVIEAHTYQLATTAQGIVLKVAKQEGNSVEHNELLAIVDTVPLLLRLQEVKAMLAELDQTQSAKQAEIASGEADLRGLAREYGRIGDLADKGSVAMQSKDDLGTKVESANLKLKSARLMLKSLDAKRKAVNARIAQLEDQLSKCYMRSPAKGVIISRHKNSGDVLSPGMPVLEIATLDTVYADFFVPQPSLAQLKYGQEVRIRLDTPSEDEEVFAPATITWISDEAEFSPKNIQTRESRNELVFKVRATAANTDGLLKRGLPVEVWK